MNDGYVVSFRIPTALKARVEAQAGGLSANQALRALALEHLLTLDESFAEVTPDVPKPLSPEAVEAQRAGYALVEDIDRVVDEAGGFDAAYAKLLREIQGV